MDTAYSKRTAAEKLGILPDKTWLVINPPANYRQAISPLPQTVHLDNTLPPNCDGIHLFVKKLAEAQAAFPLLKNQLAPAGFLWVSWPKKQYRQDPLLNENNIRDTGLLNGLVDVKVISLDKEWSGLKFVFRLQDRTLREAR